MDIYAKFSAWNWELTWYTPYLHKAIESTVLDLSPIKSLVDSPHPEAHLVDTQMCSISVSDGQHRLSSIFCDCSYKGVDFQVGNEDLYAGTVFLGDVFAGILSEKWGVVAPAPPLVHS
jgi:hypothetical protein